MLINSDSERAHSLWPRRLGVAVVLVAILGGLVSLVAAREGDKDDPIVIGHRGASGLRPEHTLESYRLAIQEGADYIEPDLVSTKDRVLVARHENEISGTTDVASHPEFATRRVPKVIDGVTVTGWFTEDFTLAELKTLRARERLPELRGTQFDGLFEIPTLQEVIDLAKQYSSPRGGYYSDRGRVSGIYPETKHPSYFDSIGLSLEEPLLRTLRVNGYIDKRDAVFIQSFETSNLKELARISRLSMVQLIDASGKPYDFVLKNDPRTYADLVKPNALAEIAAYADGVGVNKNLIFPRDAQNRLLPHTTLIRDAHAAGLIVHGWTFRAENSFLPADFRIGTNIGTLGDMNAEVEAFLKLGLDGFFTDFPGIGNAARDAFVEKRDDRRDDRRDWR